MAVVEKHTLTEEEVFELRRLSAKTTALWTALRAPANGRLFNVMPTDYSNAIIAEEEYKARLLKKYDVDIEGADFVHFDTESGVLKAEDY